MVKEMPSSTVSSRDEECLRKSLMEVVKSDSSSICRLCLSKEQKLTRVFEDESGIDDALLKKIFDCTSVKVKLKNIFPSAICAICDLKLNDFYKFREKCIENNTILHNLLGETDLSSEVQDPGKACEPAKDEEYMQQDEGKEPEQQAATSTTSITEGQQNDSTVAIALNQLSELGIRTMLDMVATEKEDGSDMGGSIRVAKNLIATPVGEKGSNVVSSSWGPTVQAAAPAESVSNAHSTHRKRTCGAAEMEMDPGAGTGLRREGKYECKECRRTFRNAYTLRRHNNLHTRTNLFPCEYCGKKFNDRSNWKIHQRSHTGDNLYTCLVCLKTFISPSTLKYHLRSHRRLESFDCRVCHESFGSYDLLEEHARNLHQQQGYMGMEDYVADGDQLIDAARFVKIELEDGELPPPAMATDISTTSQSKRMVNHSIGDEDEDLDEDMQLPDEGMVLREANDTDHQHRQEHQELVGSSLGQGCPVSHAQVAQLVEQRRQQLLEQVLHEQAKNMGVSMTGDEMATIKQETPADRSSGGGGDDVEVKEEPLDDSFEMDPSELLQQAMEEADAGDQEKEHSSSSSSSPSTVIMFRCDYCMKIFRYLDELNAHMVLHNGVNGAGGNSALVLGSLDSSGAPSAVAHLPFTDQMRTNEHDASQLQALMLKQFATSRSRPIGSEESSFAGAISQQYSAPTQQLQVVYRRAVDGDASAITERRRNAFEPDPEEIGNVPPPEHPCSKCSKMFRTEELRRVHEATHANDELVTKVRSCRFCNKVFKCELNLLAHLRKHHSHHSVPGEPDGGTGGADSSGSGNEESCSSISNAIQQQQQQLDRSTTHVGTGEELHGDGGGVISDGEAGSGSTGGKSRASRRCEICAISFTDGALLEKHVLSHFERNEAVAFVPSTDRPFKCTECHKRFKRKDYLLIHIRTHTGERRYKCDLCSSAFVHPSNLITHRKLHSNERPHKCNLCSATFKLFAGLKIHRRRCEQKLPRLTSGSSDQEDHCFRWGK